MTGYLVGGLKMDGPDVELLWVDTADEREGTTCKGTWDLLTLGYTVPEPVTGRRFAGSEVPEETCGGLDAYHRVMSG